MRIRLGRGFIFSIDVYQFGTYAVGRDVKYRDDVGDLVFSKGNLIAGKHFLRRFGHLTIHGHVVFPAGFRHHIAGFVIPHTPQKLVDSHVFKKIIKRVGMKSILYLAAQKNTGPMFHKCTLYFSLLLLASFVVSCRKDDTSVEPPRDRAEQYATDIDAIKEYLQTHYMTVSETNGLIDVSVAEIPENGTQTSIWDNTEYPLQFKTIKNPDRSSYRTTGRIDDPVDYTLYYLILNEGGGASATVTDSVYCSYRGWTLDGNEFDRTEVPIWSTYPALAQDAPAFIGGFREFVPELRASERRVDNGDGTFTFENSGVGVVFIPSGLAYFNASRLNISAYSPLVFLVRLGLVKERDHDRDRIMSKYENRDANGNVVEDLFTVDSDGDEIPDFLDTDDDNDSYSTKNEIRITPGGSDYYPFDLIPNCSGGSKKKHLDPNCN